jgi:molybdopterin-guanine dinucleotide biosynthesis protein B
MGAGSNIVGIIGASAMRDRNLVEEIILSLRFDGWSVSTLKRAPDGFDLDQTGKVSHRRREAGCREVMLVGDRRLALMMEFRDDPQPSPETLAARLLPVDVVIAEGFRDAALPTIEVFVASRQPEPRCHSDPNIVAVVTDDPVECAVPCFRPDDTDGLCRLIVERLALARPPSSHAAVADDPGKR